LEFVVDKEALGQNFYYYSGFPCQFLLHRLLHTHHHHHPTSGVSIGLSNSGLSVAQPQKEKLNGTRWLLAYIDHVSLLGMTYVDTTEKNTEHLSAKYEEVGLEINIEKARFLRRGDTESPVAGTTTAALCQPTMKDGECEAVGVE
jgi:hypothetical protein